ncbi:MAG: hypothetical protein OEQ53_06045, partial [Saprospiraceae bacterium]|nr:hypothetical protein [Saprospiraceae bacterium]
TIVRDDATLHISHLAPTKLLVKAVETPHYLKTLQNAKHLEREGMLTISGQTNGQPLVMANLLTTSISTSSPEISTSLRSGYISGLISHQNFAFSTKPGNQYTVAHLTTDALAITWDDERIFVAKAKSYQDQRIKLVSEVPITFEFSSDGAIIYYIEKDGKLIVSLNQEASSVILNDKRVEKSADNTKTWNFTIPKGEGSISFRF